MEAGQLGLTLAEGRAANPAEAIAAWSGLAPRVQALWMVPDLTTVTPAVFEYLLELSFRSRLVGRLLAGVALPSLLAPDEPRLSVKVKTARTLELSLPPVLLEAAQRYPEGD